MTNGANQVRVLTFNTLFKGEVRRRLRALGPILQRSDADFVCLQEVMYRQHVRLLQAAAPAYRHVAVNGSVLLKGGLAVLSRWPLRDHRFTRFRLTRPVRPEFLMRKGIQTVIGQLPGCDLAIVNTHLSANRDTDWSEANRYTAIARRELDRLTQVVSTLDSAIPLLVVGDFNLPRQSPVLARFREQAGLTDLMAGHTEPTYRPTPQWPNPPALDQVYLRPAPSHRTTAAARLVFKARVPMNSGVSAYLSDHYGIEADLTLVPG